MMRNPKRNRPLRLATKAGVAFALVLGLSALPAIESAYADPPPWAPAHGWRAKQKNKHKRKHYYAYNQPRPYFDYAPSLGIDRGFCSRQVVGTLLGAAGGGYLGSKIGKGDGQLAAVGAGVFLGALLGGSIGRSMDELDQNCVGHALESAGDGQAIAWNNPDGGQYTVVPTSTYERSGRYCREYTTTATIGGRTETIYGTSCRQPDGSWELTN